MDYKYRQIAIAVATCVVLMVVTVVFISNWQTISRKFKKNETTSSIVVETAVSEADAALESAVKTGNFTGVMVGSDLYAWMNDESFFDSDEKPEEIEKRVTKEVIPAIERRNENTGREAE